MGEELDADRLAEFVAIADTYLTLGHASVAAHLGEDLALLLAAIAPLCRALEKTRAALATIEDAWEAAANAEELASAEVRWVPGNCTHTDVRLLGSTPDMTPVPIREAARLTTYGESTVTVFCSRGMKYAFECVTTNLGTYRTQKVTTHVWLREFVQALPDNAHATKRRATLVRMERKHA